MVTVGTYLSVLYDLDSHGELRTWDHSLSSAAFSSDGRRLVTVHADVAVWDAERGAEICRIEGCTPLKESSSTYPGSCLPSNPRNVLHVSCTRQTAAADSP